MQSATTERPIDHLLADGTTIHIRDIRPDDAAELRAGFERLSAQSRYRRFLGGIGSLTPELVRYLTEVDGVDHVALVATRTAADGREVGDGVARFVRVRDAPTVAEAAITVTDEMQGKGVGRALGEALAQQAIGRGIEHFRGEVLIDNTPCRELLAAIGAEITPAEQGRLEFDVALVRHDGQVGDLVRRVMRAAADGSLGSRLS